MGIREKGIKGRKVRGSYLALKKSVKQKMYTFLAERAPSMRCLN